MNQQDLDKAFKLLPNAGDYPSDIYLIPMLSNGYTLFFRKQSFAIYPFGIFKIWGLENIELI